MKIKKRTTVDFSKHIVLETHLKNDNHSLDIWDIKLPDSNYTNRIRFINSCGTLTINGDFGNWVFCREFHPSPDGYVSDGYWAEKLQIGSVQESAKYDSERTEKEIKHWIRKGLKDYGFEGKELKTKKEQFKELLEHTEDELSYTHFAFRESEINDYELIPYCKTGYRWLEVIFDAFEELCKREKTKPLCQKK
jgi:hypothetical protein